MPQVLARGQFESPEHPASGVAQVIEVRGNRRGLTLTRFETDNGPELRVYLTSAYVIRWHAFSAGFGAAALRGL